MSGGTRGVLSIAGGTAAGQLLVLLSAPIITRLFTPQAFGVFSVISALSMVLASVLALRLELAIPLPADEQSAFGLVKLAIISIGVTSAVACFIIGALHDTFDALLGNGDGTPWIWWVPLLAALIACFAVLNQLAIRQQRFASIGRRNFLQQGATVGLQTGLGLVGFGPAGLIMGAIIGQGVGVLSLLPGASLAGHRQTKRERRGQFRRLLSRYRRFPIFLTPAALLNNAGQQAPLLLVALLYNAQVAGWLGLTFRVLAIPMVLCGLAVAQVFLSNFSRAVHVDAGRAEALFRRATKKLLLFAVAVVALVMLLAPSLFSTIFGQEWAQSGQFARALALGVGAQLVASPLSQTLIVLEAQKLQLAWDFGRLVVVCLAVVVPASLGADAPTTLWVLSVASLASYGGSWIISWMSIRRLQERC